MGYLLPMYSYGSPHMVEQKQDGQLEHTCSSSMRIRDVALKTCQRRWTIRRNGERGSGISVLAARHDDDDDDYQSHPCNRRAIIVFNQQLKDKGYPNFSKGICQKVGLSVWLEFQLVYSKPQSSTLAIIPQVHINIDIGWLAGWLGLRYINHCRLLIAKLCLYIYIKYRLCKHILLIF